MDCWNEISTNHCDDSEDRFTSLSTEYVYLERFIADNVVSGHYNARTRNLTKVIYFPSFINIIEVLTIKRLASGHTEVWSYHLPSWYKDYKIA